MNKDKHIQKIQEQVYEEIYNSIKKGLVEFKNGEKFSADEWNNLSDDEKEKHPFRWKNNKCPIVEKRFIELIKQDKLFKDDIIIDEDTGEFKFNLTEESRDLKILSILLNYDLSILFNDALKSGVGKLSAQFLIIDKDKGLEGNKRIRGKEDE